MPINIFPHALARIGGGPYSRFEELKLNESMRVILDIRALQLDIKDLKNIVSEGLFESVRVLGDIPASQKYIINLRRDLFNDRQVSFEKLQKVELSLNPSLLEDIHVLLQKQSLLVDLKANGESVFREELNLLRDSSLKQFALEENLQNGLLLSSQSLLQSIEGYVSTNSDAFRKGELHTERSLIKYLSRMYTKTSPFSSFNKLAIVGIAHLKDKPLVLKHTDITGSKVISHVRLNNFLYKYVMGLLLKNPEIYRHFLLRPNPTIQQKSDQYVFLTNSNNVEAFQRMPFNNVTEIFRVLASKHYEGIVYEQMIQHIIDNENIDADREALESFVNQLVKYGFLEFNIGVSGIDPDWDIKLHDKLNPVVARVPSILDFQNMLVRVREWIKEYETASTIGRGTLLQNIYEAFRNACFKLHEAGGLPAEERKTKEEYLRELTNSKKNKSKLEQQKPIQEVREEKEEEPFKHEALTFFNFSPEQMIYEDATLLLDAKLDEVAIMQLVKSLHLLLQSMVLFEGTWEEKESMIHFYKTKYGKVSFVDLLTFYEDYYREYKKPEAERMENRKKNQKEREKNKGGETGTPTIESLPDISSILKRQQLRREWQDKLAEIIAPQLVSENDEILINYDHINKVNKEMSIELESTNCSYGCFLQTFEDLDGKYKGVLNGTFPGYGKMLSRFLHVVQPIVTEDIRKWNMDLHNDSVLVEDCDASYFNANLHPPVLPYEIWMPSGHNSLSEKQQIAVTELLVGMEPDGKRLQLVHKETQKPVFIFDIGFQGHGGRSKLFQLLEKFTLARYLSANPITGVINNILQPKSKSNTETQEKKEGGIIVRPRLVYDNLLILQRKAWFVPMALLPLIRPKETDWSYFERLNQWRLDQKIPEEVFVYVTPRGIQTQDGEVGNQKITRDDYKPQYVNFANPFLVKLFERLLPKVSNTLRIDEMLPNSSQLNSVDCERYVTEFVVQWYVSGDKL